MKTSVVITGLLLLLLANMLMVYYSPYGFFRREGFQNAAAGMNASVAMNTGPSTEVAEQPVVESAAPMPAAAEEATGTPVVPQTSTVSSSTSITDCLVQNLPRQTWVVATVKVTSSSTLTNTASQTFRVVFK